MKMNNYLKPIKCPTTDTVVIAEEIANVCKPPISLPTTIYSKMEASHSSKVDGLFKQICELCNTRLTLDWIDTIKTTKGNTQNSERQTICKIKEILNELHLEYDEAGSQQSKDFRNVGRINLNIEIKKTDNTIIYFNDTYPSPDIYYIIIFTGKTYKTNRRTSIPAQVLYLNGSDFTKDCEWIEEFITELTALKDKYGRGDNKKHLSGIMSVYPRPTFKADITSFLRFM